MVTHNNLASGYQTAQVAHALAEYAIAFPEEFSKWHKVSNFVVVLAAKDEKSLRKFAQDLRKRGIGFKSFQEPDLGYELTSIALTPSQATVEACRGLSLAGNNHSKNDLCQDFKIKEGLKQRMNFVEDLKNHEQASGISIYQHGEMVMNKFLEIKGFLEDGENQHISKSKEWKIPPWIMTHREQFLDAINSYGTETITKYLFWHDCGKPQVKTVDLQGKHHFPDHEKSSVETYLKYYPGDEEVSDFIGKDMFMHTSSIEEVKNFYNSNPKMALVLAISALAELHANGSIFGGIESDSFKIKWKKLDRRVVSMLDIKREKMIPRESAVL